MLRTIGLVFCIVMGLAARADEPKKVTVTPKEIDALLANPGMGWQTFHRFADQDKELAGLPSGSAYYRFYWNEIEKEEGKIDFPMFDRLLEHAHRAGQKLALRIMCVGTEEVTHVPAYVRKNARGKEFQYLEKGPMRWTPDYDDPVFQKAHFRLIEELGKRYDGHRDLDLIDIGSVGLWGEWHMSNTGVEMPPPATQRKIIEAWCRAFPKTPRVMLLAEADALKYAFTQGCGWRADCLGDMGGFSKRWSHMKDLYPRQLEACGAADVWKTAPVAFEDCWDMRKWKQEGWDIPFIFDYALSTHTSFVNNKSAPIPDGTRPEIERLLKKLGYRLVLRSLEHDASIARGEKLALKMAWENVGVAPPYRDERLALRLTDRAGKHVTLVGKTSVRGWLPGKIDAAEPLEIPKGLESGSYKLAIGIVDPSEHLPEVRLAIEGRDAEGWYPLSEMTIRN